MIGIVSVAGDSSTVRVALLSHYWDDFYTVQRSQEWGGLAGCGYHYAAGERAFIKDCAGREPAAPATPQSPPADLATRRDLCQAALDAITMLPEMGMYTKVAAQLARRGLEWRGRCLTEQDVINALGDTPVAY
jgi:hypothetical protein